MKFSDGNKIVCLCAGLLLLSGAALPGFDLVRDGEAAAGIRTEGTEPGLKLAKEEIIKYTKAVTGAELQESKPGIVITTLASKEVPEEIRKKLSAETSDEAFFMGKAGDEFYIVGTSGIGAWYGACDFMEKYLGVRWLTPYENGTFFPEKKSVQVPDEGRIDRPVFPFRLLNQVAGHGFDPETREWAGHNRMQAPGPWGIKATMETYRDFHEQRMRLNRTSDGGHLTFSNPVSRKEYAESHPEYFALVDGVRQVDAKMLQHCITNPEVKELVYQYICRHFEKYGTENVSWLFGAPDTATDWCECEECRKLDNDAKINVSRRFHSVTQEIAKRVWEKYPDARIWIWAYWNYREIPEGVEIDPRTYVYFCPHRRCYAHTLDDPSCPRNAAMFELLKKWRKISDRVFIYEYDIAVPYGSQPYEEVMLQDLKLYRKLGLLGRKEEFILPRMRFVKKENIWRTFYRERGQWQFWYLLTRGAWDPEIDFESSLEEIESLFYGKTYPAMKKYHALRRQLWKETPGCVGFPLGDDRTPRVLSRPGAREELLALLDEAALLAKGDARLEKEIGIERGLLQENWILPNEKYREIQGRSLSAPSVSEPPVIDGRGDDPVWGSACYITDFRTAFDGKKSPCPAELATSLGILSDRENLYFLIQAKEPHPEKMVVTATPDAPDEIWPDDIFEIFIVPLNNSMKYYQLAVNPAGALLDLEQPGNNAGYKLNAEVKASRSRDGWIVEMKVPVEKMDGVFASGTVWHLHAARTRRVKDELPATGWSLDGTGYHALTDYRPLTIGTPILRNGDFEGPLDEKGNPKFWGVSKTGERIQTPDGGFAFQLLPGGDLRQILYGKVFMPQAECPLEIAFRASGKGKIRVCNARFTQKDGRNVYLGSETVFEGDLSEKDMPFTASFTVRPNEFAQLIFSVSGEDARGVLDDVSVTCR